MQIETIRPILLQNPAIAGVTGSSGNIMSLQSGTASSSWEGKMGDGVVMLTQVRVDSAFLRVMEIPLVAGSNFTNPAEPEIILNRSAVDAMGLENPVGKRMEASIQGKIIGVVNDFNFRSLHETISPLILYIDQTSTLYVRIKAGGAKQACRFGKTMERI